MYVNNEELQFHIKCKKGDVGKYCILTGDPKRCAKIAAHFDNAKLIADFREYVIYTGSLDGEKISVCSTGIGGPSAAIAMEELANIGAEKFIRIGTCGGININVKAGDIVIVQASVRQEGTSLEYAPIAYPAVADFALTSALLKAAQSKGASYHIGVVQSKDSFYGQHSPERMPVSCELTAKWNAYKQLGVLASEMETAALFTVAAVRGVKCAAILTAIWNQEREKAGLDQNSDFDTELCIKCAVSAFKEIIENDRKKKI